MADKQKLAKIWTSVCSNSIANWHEKIDRRFGLKQEYRLFQPVIFFGMYHWVDWLKLLIHRGEKKIFWCGSDLVNIQQSLFRFIIPYIRATHVCENHYGGEWTALHNMGIEAKVLPQFFSDPAEFYPSFKSVSIPHVFINCHENRTAEYGLDTVASIAPYVNVVFHVYGCTLKFEELLTFSDNFVFHGKVPEDIFNEQIKNYQCGLRLNEFDGNSEVVMKSILLGQYPITRIAYPKIDCYNNKEELIELLNNLKNHTVENPQSIWWREHLEESKRLLLE